MAELILNEQFDVIVCLFGSIGYIKKKEDLRKAIEGFVNHLRLGGIVIIEPWLTQEIYRRGSPHMVIYDGEDLKIARLNISEQKGDLSIIDMHYLIAESNKPVVHVVDRHELVMFPHEYIMDLMKTNGLETTKIINELFTRGLLIGVKKS